MCDENYLNFQRVQKNSFHSFSSWYPKRKNSEEKTKLIRKKQERSFTQGLTTQNKIAPNISFPSWKKWKLVQDNVKIWSDSGTGESRWPQSSSFPNWINERLICKYQYHFQTDEYA